MENQGDKVSLKKKVTLRQKQSEATLSPIHTNPKPKPKKWLWLIPAAIVIAGSALAIANRNGEDKADQIAMTDVPQLPTRNEVPSVPTDETVSADEFLLDSSTNKDNSSTANETKSSQENPVSKVTDSKVKDNADAASSATLTTLQRTNTTVDSQSGSTSNSTPSLASLSSSVDENALRVIRGEFGNGQERKNALGDRYTEIQSRVNEMYREGRFN